MNSRPKDPKTARNKNVLVIGGSGSGKTRFWLKPNLMQMHSSYVVTDPKGTILVECGKMLQRGAPKLGKDGKPMKDKHGKVIYEPYRIKVLNTINFKKSILVVLLLICFLYLPIIGYWMPREKNRLALGTMKLSIISTQIF
jgi:type IV secretion system protein VirD4